MRAYFFGNMYLSSIQQGIQAAHVTHELFNKYIDNPGSGLNTLSLWAEDHKTMILLNAGYGENIRALVERFNNSENPYPWADFHEGQDALDGALTCVGIVLPEKIYETASMLRSIPFRSKVDMIESIRDTGEVDLVLDGEDVTCQLSKWEFDLVIELGNYGMAS